MYRSETIFGLPSTQPISRRYQYGRPWITFLYRLAIFRSYAYSKAESSTGTGVSQGKPCQLTRRAATRNPWSSETRA